MESNTKTRKSLGTFVVLFILIVSFTLMSGCTEQEDGLGEPEDVFMEITSATTRQKDFNGINATEGYEFLELEVEMTNEKDEPLEIYWSDFEVEGPDKRSSFGATQSKGMVSSIGAGETTEFILLFEILEGWTAELIFFRPSNSAEPVSWTEVPVY